MARPLRLEFPGALYHVTSRGNRQEDIYQGDDDRQSFLDLLGSVCETYNWVCHAYCLMDNHYHLLIETPDANLTRGMRQLNGVYTQTYNRLNNCVGHVFQGRYKAILVEKDSYLLELSRYIVLNPVRARMVTSVEEWQWSSYLETIGKKQSQTWLSTEWLLSLFAKTKKSAIRRYTQFVEEGVKQTSPWSCLRKQVYLGSDQFMADMQLLVDGDKELTEIPAVQRRPTPKILAEYEKLNESRNATIASAYRSGGYTLKEIGQYFGLHYSTVSGIIKNHSSKT